MRFRTMWKVGTAALGMYLVYRRSRKTVARTVARGAERVRKAVA